MITKKRGVCGANRGKFSDKTIIEALDISQRPAFIEARTAIVELDRRLTHEKNNDKIMEIRTALIEMFRNLKSNEIEVYNALKTQGNGIIEKIADRLVEEVQILD